MIAREPNGEPRLLMILAIAGLGEASRSTGTGFRQRADPRRPCLAENAGSRGVVRPRDAELAMIGVPGRQAGAGHCMG